MFERVSSKTDLTAAAALSNPNKSQAASALGMQAGSGAIQGAAKEAFSSVARDKGTKTSWCDRIKFQCNTLKLFICDIMRLDYKHLVRAAIDQMFQRIGNLINRPATQPNQRALVTSPVIAPKPTPATDDVTAGAAPVAAAVTSAATALDQAATAAASKVIDDARQQAADARNKQQDKLEKIDAAVAYIRTTTATLPAIHEHIKQAANALQAAEERVQLASQQVQAAQATLATAKHAQTRAVDMAAASAATQAQKNARAALDNAQAVHSNAKKQLEQAKANHSAARAPLAAWHDAQTVLSSALGDSASTRHQKWEDKALAAQSRAREEYQTATTRHAALVALQSKFKATENETMTPPARLSQLSKEAQHTLQTARAKMEAAHSTYTAAQQAYAAAQQQNDTVAIAAAAEKLEMAKNASWRDITAVLAAKEAFNVAEQAQDASAKVFAAAIRAAQ